MKYYFRFLVLFVMFAFTSSAFGYQWNIDSDHSEIRFQVKHIFTTVSGTFNDFKGQVSFDPKMPDKGNFEFTVSVKSVNTNNGKRDNHIKSNDFFNSDKFPEMSFKSTKITHKMDNFYTLEGMMTIKDVTKNLTIDFEFFEPIDHPFDKKKKVGGFITRFTILRLDYNVGTGKFLKMGVVDSMVHVEITMEALTDK